MARKARKLEKEDRDDRDEDPLRKLLRAAGLNDVQAAAEALTEAQSRGLDVKSLQALALSRSCERGKADVARYLLSHGARFQDIPEHSLPPLLRAAEHGHVEIVQLAIEHGLSLEVADKDARTPLTIAIESGRSLIVDLLLTNGANANKPNKRGWTPLVIAALDDRTGLVKALLRHGADADHLDGKKQTVLHILARDWTGRWGDETLESLLLSNVDLTRQDELGRTSLHWASANGKVSLVEKLLKRHGEGIGGPIVRKRIRELVNAQDDRHRTPLHLAASNGQAEVVRVLLKHSADANARADGGWTPLHNACEDTGSQAVVELLLHSSEHRPDINYTLQNGSTPLHVAAEAGNLLVVKYLLSQDGILRGIEDAIGHTPLLRAAIARKREIVELLAPWNNLEALTHDALAACNSFKAAIVDFGKDFERYHNGHRVTKKSMYELLYARDQQDSSKPAVSTFPRNSNTRFRWIHLPANNTDWCKDLLTKRFIEEGATDVEGFKGLESSFDQEHRGERPHSHYMRPTCQSAYRAMGQASPENTNSEPDSSTAKPDSTVAGAQDANAQPPASILAATPVKDASEAVDVVGTLADAGRSISKSNLAASARPKGKRVPSGISVKRRRDRAAAPDSSNVFLFMPYLHFEEHERQQEMQRVLDEILLAKRDRRRKARPVTPVSSTHMKPTSDELMMRAHLCKSRPGLHIRRTLDQFWFNSTDTHVRDSDQTLYRYMARARKLDETCAPPQILMVDQLWMWVLGKDLVVTAFPQRWNQHAGDYRLDMLDGIRSDINSNVRGSVDSVYELAMIISGRCVGTFDRHRRAMNDFQSLDIYEASLGDATDRETALFDTFTDASRRASQWLRHQRPSQPADDLSEPHDPESTLARGGMRREPDFVDKLLDIGEETALLREVKDIQDELLMISLVLEQQESVLPNLKEIILSSYPGTQSTARKRRTAHTFEEQQSTVQEPIKDIKRMHEQAKRIYSSVTDLLDVKQKHANAIEARYAREQASDTARQGQTIMVFTIVTVIFLPLSFIAAFFAININEFPHNGNGNSAMSLSYVSRYVFGIGLGIAIPCIVIALSWAEIYKLIARWRIRRAQSPRRESDATMVSPVEQRRFSLEPPKVWRRSHDHHRNGRPVIPAIRTNDEEPKVSYRWLARRSTDVESNQAGV